MNSQPKKVAKSAARQLEVIAIGPSEWHPQEGCMVPSYVVANVPSLRQTEKGTDNG